MCQLDNRVPPNPYIIIIIIKYQIYIALISNKCSEALNSAT